MPQLWFIAGSNGAGKTTTAQWAARSKNISLPPTLNADDRARQKSLTALDAAREIDADLRADLAAGKDTAVETVLSSDKYLEDAAKARARGYLVLMIYIALPTADMAVERVRLRVGKGGHDVPEDRIRERWERSHDMLARFIAKDALDILFVYANHGPAEPPLIAEGEREGGGFEVRLINSVLLPRVTQALRPFLNSTGI